MKTNLYLIFSGSCREAFAFYEKTFGSKIQQTLTYGDAPAGSPVPPEAKDLIMYTSMPLGSFNLMGMDDPRGQEKLGGFKVSVETTDEAEVKRIFAELSKDGSVQMPLAQTFWSPLFGMLTDRFGVGWMVSVPGPQQG